MPYEEAVAAVTAPGQRFETEVIEVDGRSLTAFRHGAPSLRQLFASARERGKRDFLVYEDEHWTFAEVEAALYEHPGVHEAAVFGLPHERLGEEVAAAVVPKPGEAVTAAALEGFLRERLAGFKVPSRWLLADAPLPRNAAGKVLKHHLRDDLAGAAEG